MTPSTSSILPADLSLPRSAVAGIAGVAVLLAMTAPYLMLALNKLCLRMRRRSAETGVAYDGVVLLLSLMHRCGDEIGERRETNRIRLEARQIVSDAFRKLGMTDLAQFWANVKQGAALAVLNSHLNAFIRTHRSFREDAIERAIQALDPLFVEGVKQGDSEALDFVGKAVGLIDLSIVPIELNKTIAKNQYFEVLHNVGKVRYASRGAVVEVLSMGLIRGDKVKQKARVHVAG